MVNFVCKGVVNFVCKGVVNLGPNEQLRSGSESEQKMVRELTTYLSNNLDRMDDPAYRAMGLRVTTAAVESCNYHVIGQRLKCQGMRWGEAGAGEMSTLRADYCNGAWNQRTRQILDFAA